ncbi:MAG: PKD-like domain-containing protein [Sediminibacterium sp.]
MMNVRIPYNVARLMLLKVLANVVFSLLIVFNASGQSYTVSVCSGTAFSFTDPSAPTGTTYTWGTPTVFPTGTITGSSLKNTPQASVSQTLTNSSTASGTVTYTVTGSNSATPYQVFVTVKPNPALSSTLTPTAICSGTYFNYNPTSATAGTSFAWSRAAVNGISNTAATGTGTINELLTNTSASSVVVNYIFTLTANGCTNTQTVPVTVKPSPVLSNIATAFSNCSGSAFLYTPLSATTGTSFTWSRAAVAGISNAAVQGTSLGTINEVLTNTTANPVLVNYDYIEIANGCTNYQTITVTVNPLPTLSGTATPSAICSGATFNYTPTSLSNNTSFSWTRSPVAGINNGNTSFGVNNPLEQLTNTTLIPISVLYVYTLNNNTTGCVNTQLVQVTVNPVPNAADQIVSSCSGTNFMSSPNGVPNNTLYTWSSPTITVGSITGGSAVVVPQTFIGQVLTNNGGSTATAVYTVTPNTYGCIGSNFLVTVNVNTTNATSMLNSTLVPPAICSGTAFNYAPASITAGTNFAWKRFFTAGISTLPTSGVGNPSEVLVNSTYLPVTTYYAYTITNGTGCSNTQQVAVIVNPPTALSSSTTPTPICSNTAFTYLPTSNTLGTTFNWSRVAVAGISNTPSSGIGNPNEVLINTTTLPIIVTYNYFMSTANGCTNNQNVTVQVNPTPALTTTLTPADICSGTSFNYIPSANIAGTSFIWSRSVIPAISNGAATGINNPSEILVNTSNSPVTVYYDYTLTASGCSTIQTVAVVVNPTPTVLNLTSTACSNTAFSIAPNNVPVGTQYTWTMPIYTPAAALTGGSIQIVPQNTISETIQNQTLNNALATYTITPIAGTCVGSSFVIDITIKPVPFIADQLLAAVCSGNTFNYQPIGVPVGTVYTWSNPLQAPLLSITGGSAQSINQNNIAQKLFTNNNISDSAIYTVTPAANGCIGNSFKLTVPVSPVPVINNINDTICSGSYFSIQPGSVPSNTQYTWPTPVNYPFGANIGGAAQLVPVSIISQKLTNSTNSSAQTVYTISPVAGACAGNAFTIIETVGVSLPFISNQSATICSGTSFDATPLNAPLGTTYTWGIPVTTPVGTVSGVSGKATPQQKISQYLINLSSVTDTVVYTVVPYNTGCYGNVFSATVNVLASPKATITGRSVVCRTPNDTVSISFTGNAPWSFTYIDSTSINTKKNITTSPYTWIVPSIPNNPYRNFIVTDVKDYACLNTVDTFYFQQKVNPLPVGKIISLHGIYLCDNIVDTLFVSSSKADTLSYQWALNGTAIPGATTDSIGTLTPGNYNAILTNQYGCVDTAATSVGLILITRPNLQISYDSYCINQLIHFTNQTDTTNTGSIKWLWNFGDSTTSNSFNATNTYYTGGNRHIRLTATQLNCPLNPISGDATLDIAFPIPALRMPSVSAYKGVPTPIAARMINGYRYRWVPSWGINLPDSANVNFNYANTQEYLIHLISPAGCITPDSVLVRVFDNNLVDIMVPKSFTPNSDGTNDILYPYIAGIKTFHYFKVFNRYGKLLFETKDPDTGWSGNFNGEAQPMSIYLWMAEGIAADGTLVQKKGETLLLR